MKTLVILFLCWTLSANAFAQVGISPAEWQADLKFLQDTVHDDYPFLFKKTTAEKFDAAVERLHKAIPELKEHEIVTGLACIVSSFEYGHTSLTWSPDAIKYHQLPLNLYYFSDGIYVEGVRQDYKNILGTKLLEINGVPVEKALSDIRPVVPAENDQFFKAYGLNFLVVPEVLHAQRVVEELNNDITLTLERDGKSFRQVVTAIPAQSFPTPYGFMNQGGDWLSVRDQSATPHYLKYLNKFYYFEYLPEQKTVYVRHSQIQDDPQEAIPAFYKRVFDFVENNDVERLVLDVRLNSGGNNYKNKPIITGIIRTEKINKPGKLFVIIGRRTYSACQNLVNELDNYTNVIFVGEPSAENINFYGDNRQVVLPNSKIPVRLSFAWWQDKPQWENGPWTAPHLAVDMSFDEYRSNKDPVLEAVLSFSDDDFIVDPMAYLTKIYESGQSEEVELEAQKLVKDPKYRFVDFEDHFNRLGYDLLRSNRVQESISIFALNTNLFPESANTWDSLAEASVKANRTEKAIEYYRKVIELDPDGGGEHARNMLKEIEAKKSESGK